MSWVRRSAIPSSRSECWTLPLGVSLSTRVGSRVVSAVATRAGGIPVFRLSCWSWLPPSTWVIWSAEMGWFWPVPIQEDITLAQSLLLEGLRQPAEAAGLLIA